MKKQELLKALELVKPGLATKEMIEQSTSFAFIDGRVVTYNDEISISHPVKGLTIEGAVKAEELYKLLSKIDGDEIEIECTDTEVLLAAKKTQAGFTLQQEITLPLDELGKQGKWEHVSDDLIEAIKFCAFSCSKDMSQPEITCVHVAKDKTVESTDRLRITRYTRQEKLPVDSFLLPAASAQQLIQYPVVAIASSQGWVHFRTEHKTIFSCRVFEGAFPEVEQHFKITGNSIQLPKMTAEALDRAAVFSKRDFILDEEVKVTIGKKKIRIESRSETGWLVEDLNIQYDDQKITFLINPTMLREILHQTHKCTVAKDKIKFSSDKWEHVIALYNEDESD